MHRTSHVLLSVLCVHRAVFLLHMSLSSVFCCTIPFATSTSHASAMSCRLNLILECMRDYYVLKCTQIIDSKAFLTHIPLSIEQQKTKKPKIETHAIDSPASIEPPAHHHPHHHHHEGGGVSEEQNPLAEKPGGEPSRTFPPMHNNCRINAV